MGAHNQLLTNYPIIKSDTMATKRTPSPAKQPQTKGMSETQRWICGLLLLALAAFLLIAMVSFLLYWRDDQAEANWGGLFASAGEGVRNWGGHRGAIVANFLMGEWFGLFALCIPAALTVLGLRVMRFRPLLLSKSVRLIMILMIMGSVALGFFFGDSWSVFGTGLGGANGIYAARWLTAEIGGPGTLILLLVSFIIYAVYINRNTISVVNRVGKELVEGGKKVGEVVSTTAATLRTGERGAETDETAPEQSGEAPPTPRRRRRGADDGFEAGGVAEEQPQAPAAVADDDGFTVIDLSGAPDGESPFVEESVAPPGEVRVDENGFTITDLSPEAQPEPQQSAEPPAYPQEVDENGFIIQYAGDEAPADPGFVAAVPASAGVSSSDQMHVDQIPDDELLSQQEIDDAALYDPTLDLSTYQRPPVELLEDHSINATVSSDEIVENKNSIQKTLENFGIRIDKIKATVGPTVTLYEIVPAPGVRISKIKNLEDDIALSLSALGIRIIAPMPGKGTIGIEVPNKEPQVVSMRSAISSAKFQESGYDLPVVLGRTIQNETFVVDLARMPHLLVAGATGQGKSVGLNAIIASLLYKKHPAELKFVLVDPKKVELTLYAKLERHFLAKMPGEDDAIITDTHKVIHTLNSLCIEMDARYDLLRLAEVRHVKEYNEKFRNRRLNPRKGHRFLPYIIVIIDEFADLIMTAGREVETPIARIAQLARAVGIHLVIATQRPTTNIITGVIKANFPARIAFRVTSMIDSRTIIDQPGANQLIGRGDMLVSTGNDMIRVQCAFLDTPEVEQITEFIGNQRGYLGAYELPEYTPEGSDAGAAGKANDLSSLDAMFEEIARFVVQHQQGSTSAIQRRFSIGYNRAGRIMDQLEMAGVVGRSEGSKPREVLISDMLSLEHLIDSLG